MDSATTEDPTALESTATLNTRPCVMYYFIAGGLVGGFISVIGLTGNIFSLIILGKERKKSSTIHALCLLAVADSLLLLTYMSIVPIIGLRKMIQGWYAAINQSVFASTYVYETARVFNQVSTFLTMTLMWQRYVAVCLPHKAKRLCTIRFVNRIFVCSTIASFAFYLPNFFLHRISISDDGVFHMMSHPLMHNAYFQMIYSVIFTYLVSYIIPVLSLLYMSVTTLRSHNLAQFRNSQHVRKDLTKSSIAIVTVFIICQSFQPTRRILIWVYDPHFMKQMLCGGDLLYYSAVPHLSLMLNSAANFSIYILYTRGFRRRLMAIVTRRSAVGPTVASISSTTVATQSGQVNNILNAGDSISTTTFTSKPNAVTPINTTASRKEKPDENLSLAIMLPLNILGMGFAPVTDGIDLHASYSNSKQYFS
ncbi:hypothetical protein CAPTEDRAFT_201100 [Capitella teleta]|uniref:G-protein coupled receptors family 1 profile domain-containing protein n=1 Tax=Capitella teleta TaxID=283909 RepID=R7UEB4_CAPTE|nr:hypothetical protein CAPTEDRAFT_201100 [Capitella teleta]|eukprot:ELU04319.1 hypothetical protein CAPTEDRAFT_201100 [Capitella teleta]